MAASNLQNWRGFRAPIWTSALAIVALLAGGCASNNWVTLRATPRNPLAQSLRLLAPEGPRPSDRTMQLLRRLDLAGDVKGDRFRLLAKLDDLRAREPSPELTYAKAELAYLGGKRAELTNERVALDLYGTSVMHAYLYLFGEHLTRTPNPYDPQFRGACDLYNAALEDTLRITRKRHELRPNQVCSIQTATRRIDMPIVLRGKNWHAEDLSGEFEFVSDYEVHGLRNHYRTFGLGVPLIAVRQPHAARQPAEQYYPDKLSFPVTAFLRVVRSTDADATRSVAPAEAVLELYDPLATSSILVADRRIPLESDLSTPLAYFLSQPEFDDERLATLGLLDPARAAPLRGLYMMEPYRPDKIPVVMVHGLWSSPVTWMEMFNDLRSDPAIRDYYQFWFYLYPTGQPFWFSAAQMREDLGRVRRTLDPDQHEPALDEIVLVGHSMGGLLAKLQTVDSENAFWHIVTDRPFAELRASDEVRDRLAKTFFFHPNSSIRRVVMIGTPHGGSPLANNATRWLAQRLINLPARIIQGRQTLLRDNPGYFRAWDVLNVNTSIDSLDPDSPFLPVLLSARHAPWVTYHNIAGRVPARGMLGRVAGDGDGVVSLASATTEDTVSQIVVEADHMNVHRHPRTILEVRRILLEHLESLRMFPYPVQRLPAPREVVQ